VRRLCILLPLLVVVGCGSDKSETLPPACTQGPVPIEKALVKAPGAVALDGTRISECFNRDASGDDVQILGTGIVAAAQHLGDRARGGDEQAALQLGYLIGATQRGARRNGLGSEIVRRIEAEASGFGRGRAAYQQGLRAGRAQG
jgi:hypothetical protein